jgi:hypothetical protein
MRGIDRAEAVQQGERKTPNSEKKTKRHQQEVNTKFTQNILGLGFTTRTALRPME